MPFVVCTSAGEVKFRELLNLQSLSLEGGLESYIPCLILDLGRHRIVLLMWRKILLQGEPKALLIHVHCVLKSSCCSHATLQAWGEVAGKGLSRKKIHQTRSAG